MAMEEKIFAMVQALAGSQADREETVRSLCRATEAALSARLLPGLTPEDCGDSFVCAAAWHVWAALSDGEMAGGIYSFTAGDVTVHKDGNGATQQLRQQAETLLAPYVQDGFSFLGVRG